MKVNELRIGNIVLRKTNAKISGKETTLRDYVRVVGILENTVFFDLFDVNGRRDIQDVEPILLTEEILLKYGFIRKEYYISIEWEKEDLTIEQSKEDFFCGTDDEVGNNGFSTQLKYLHQLQNLYFALREKELDVNL